AILPGGGSPGLPTGDARGGAMTHARARVLTAWLPLLLAVATPMLAGSAQATRIFTTNHLNSNDARGLVSWNGRLAAATTGGGVLAQLPAGPFSKVIRSTGGLPSNQTLCAVTSPAGLPAIGTVDTGIASLR